MDETYEPYGAMLDVQLATTRLRDSGARMTAQRRAVLEILKDNRTHPTAEVLIEQVKAKLGCVAPATIYNTLQALEALGFVRRIDGLEARAHFDPDTSSHQHAICSHCKWIWDVSSVDLPVDMPDGFLLRDILFLGSCDKCATA